MWFFFFFTTLFFFLSTMLSKDSNSSNILGDLEYQDYRNKFWSSSTPINLLSKPTTFQPLGKEESYTRHIRSETFPVTKDESFYPSDTHPTNKYLKNTMMNAPSYVPSNLNYNKQYYKKDDSFESLQDDYNKLKGELILKNQIIKNLTDQINMMTKTEARSSSFKLPKNHYQLFQDLLKTLQDKSIELQETNQRLEAVLVANNFSDNYDVEELSHKLVHKLSQLLQENENLLKIISFGNKTNLLIEIGLLKHEIQQLKNEK